MIQKIWENILKGEDIRKNLSNLRENIKVEENRKICSQLIQEHLLFLETLLQSSDPKTRKNTALLVGDLKLNSLSDSLWKAYDTEDTLFVRSSYLMAMQKLDMTVYLEEMKAKKQMLSEWKVEETKQKHLREEMQELDKLILSIEGVKKHKFTGWEMENEIILLANRRHLDILLSELKQLPKLPTFDTKLMNAGIRLKTNCLKPLMESRTWQEMLFLVNGMKTCDKDPILAAETIANSKLLSFLEERHGGKTPFYFRVEVKMQVSANSKEKDAIKKQKENERNYLEEKQKFIKKFVTVLEDKTERKLINSKSDYEFEIRLVENKDGRFNVMVKLFTIADKRFEYRKEVVASSIRPVNAALIVQIVKEYLVENARVLDPFCGVGTMLIERQKKVPANTSYGLDIYEDAIEKARKNTEAAGQIIHYINRDCFTFTHEYLFDEIFTNMPFSQGKKTSLEIYEIYERFFELAGKLVRKDGTIVLYTHDKTYVDKLSFKSGFNILKKWQINVKEDTWVYVIKI